jgi:hypothetical protein
LERRAINHYTSAIKMDALMSMTKEQFMAMDLKDKKQLLKEWGEALDEEDKEEEEQYHKMCENDCCTMLTKDTPIMCYKTDTKEMTLCSTCYWEAGFWEDDENSDNEDEIEAHKEGEGEEELCWCKVGIKECDCDKCGRCGCYECVSGGHGENEDENWCEECEAE